VTVIDEKSLPWPAREEFVRLRDRRSYQSGPNEGRPIHPEACRIMLEVFGLMQDKSHDAIAETLSDLIYRRDSVDMGLLNGGCRAASLYLRVQGLRRV
jgi:hypothetical protein